MAPPHLEVTDRDHCREAYRDCNFRNAAQRRGVSTAPSVQPEQHLAGVNPYAVGIQIEACRAARGCSGLVIELTVVLWALDRVAHHQAVGKVSALVGAQTVGGMEGVCWAPVDR